MLLVFDGECILVKDRFFARFSLLQLKKKPFDELLRSHVDQGVSFHHREHHIIVGVSALFVSAETGAVSAAFSLCGLSPTAAERCLCLHHLSY